MQTPRISKSKHIHTQVNTRSLIFLIFIILSNIIASLPLSEPLSIDSAGENWQLQMTSKLHADPSSEDGTENKSVIHEFYFTAI